jgi:hypothetical protein
MKITELLTQENAKKVADEVVSAFEKEISEKTLEVDFKMNAGLMEINYPTAELKEALYKIHNKNIPLPNTSFSFNTTSDSMLQTIKNGFCELIENGVLTEQDHETMTDFIAQIINQINSDDSLIQRIKSAIRRVNMAPEDVFPFADTAVVLFEFGEKEDYGDMIKVANYSRYNKQLQSFVGEKRAIAQDLLLRRREFGYNSNLPTVNIYSMIIDEQKAASNPMYADVLIEDVKIVREAKECHLDIFVNYSPISKEEYEAKLQKMEINNEQES